MTEDVKLPNLLLQEPSKDIFEVSINRPNALNAINLDTLTELENVLDWIDAHKTARVLLITGSGNKAFVAGADISYMSQLSSEQGHKFSERGSKLFLRLERLSIPVIALVNGYALGGGCELALSCDLIIASENAQFGQPEINLGIVPGFGGSQRLIRKIGQLAATELLMSGRKISAEEAHRLQLINKVCSVDELQAEGLKLAEMIKSKNIEAIAAIKKLVQQGQNVSLESACSLESALFGLTLSSQGGQEGMKAFLDSK